MGRYTVKGHMYTACCVVLQYHIILLYLYIDWCSTGKPPSTVFNGHYSNHQNKVFHDHLMFFFRCMGHAYADEIPLGEPLYVYR